MNLGRTVFSQIIEHLPEYEFQKCVARYRGDSHLRGFSCLDQYLAMSFAQLTYRESLRDIRSEAPARIRIPEVRGPLSRRLSLTRLLVFGPVSGNVLCAVDLPREPARYRGVPAVGGKQTLPYGIARQGIAHNSGRRQ